MTNLPYDTCPKCGSPGVSRERRPNGNDKCEGGHSYPSSTAGTRVVKKVLPDGTKLAVAMSTLKAGTASPWTTWVIRKALRTVPESIGLC